jgi:predicted nucleic acid-binding protein
MKIAITDANIFIDLLEADLLGFLFQIDYEIHTTLEVLNELFEEQERIVRSFVASKQLYIKAFSPSELTQLYNESFPRGLSIVDQGLIFYAIANTDYLILSNDGLLRKTAKQRQVEIHGSLWVLDCLHEKNLVSNQRLCGVLKHLQKGGFRRLPVKEIEERLAAWS